MIGWSSFLNAEEAESIRAYVAARARILQESEAPSSATAAPALPPPAIEPPPIEPPVIDPAAVDPTAL
jgi:hypothetical protein